MNSVTSVSFRNSPVHPRNTLVCPFQPFFPYLSQSTNSKQWRNRLSNVPSLPHLQRFVLGIPPRGLDVPVWHHQHGSDKIIDAADTLKIFDLVELRTQVVVVWEPGQVGRIYTRTSRKLPWARMDAAEHVAVKGRVERLLVEWGVLT